VTAMLEMVGVGLWQVTVVLFVTEPLVAVIVTEPAAMHLTVWDAVFGVLLTTIVWFCRWKAPPASSCCTVKE